MPAIKNALLRYRIIDRSIRNEYNPYPTKEQLRQACEEEIYGTLKIQVVEKESIIHLSCIFKEATEYDVNFKETEIETEPWEITWSFDLNKQILLDTNFKNNPPVVASIDKSYIWINGYIIMV